MNKSVLGLCIFSLLASTITAAYAAPAKCAREKSAFDRSGMDVTKAESQLSRLENGVDSKVDQGEYRKARLEGDVEAAQGNLKAVETGAVGQGLGCLLSPRPGCAGPTTSRVLQNIGRARAMVKARQGRLEAFVKAFNLQMTRLSARVTKQEDILRAKRATLATKDSEYAACMRS